MRIGSLIIAICFSFSLHAEKAIPLSFEVASSPQEIMWGLMGRRHLPPDHGMLFVYPQEKFLAIWMFNTWIDLSLAFLDSNLRVLEIHEMKAYPEMMDPRRVVKSPRDLGLYSSGESIVQFFLNRSVHSSVPVKYALEMNKHWFSLRGVKIGDTLVLDKAPYFYQE